MTTTAIRPLPAPPGFSPHHGDQIGVGDQLFNVATGEIHTVNDIGEYPTSRIGRPDFHGGHARVAHGARGWSQTLIDDHDYLSRLLNAEDPVSEPTKQDTAAPAGPDDILAILLQALTDVYARMAKIRALCRTDDHGGGAAFVRLDNNEPVDEHGRYAVAPALAVPVSDVLAVLDEAPAPPDLATFVLAVDEARDLHHDAARIKERLLQLACASRKDTILMPPYPAGIFWQQYPTQQYPTMADLGRALTGNPEPAPDADVVADREEADRVQLRRVHRIVRRLLETGILPGAGGDGVDLDTIYTAVTERYATNQPSRDTVVHAVAIEVGAGNALIRRGPAGRPVYAPDTRTPSPLAEETTAVIAAELLADAGPAGMTMSAIADRLAARFRIESTAPAIAACLLTLAGRGLATFSAGTYFGMATVVRAPEAAPQ